MIDQANVEEELQPETGCIIPDEIENAEELGEAHG